MSNNVNSLFQTAHDEGDLSAGSLQVLSFADIGQAIQGALGVSVDDVTSSEVVLVSMMPDDSGSIRTSGNSQIVRDGHNLVLDSLIKSKQVNAILAHCRYLNGHVLYPFSPIAQATRMDTHNYNPHLGTPLYEQSVVLLGTVLAKRQEFVDNGMVARTVTLIITDGADTGGKYDADDVKKIVADLLRQETHIIAGMGIQDSYGTDFREVFRGMGILDEWILTPGNSESEIRKAFQVFSQSAVRASQAAGTAFSQVAMGGFGG
jgi:hypothetical protein